jgi:membrane protease YdiL (CAAX protease family)
MSAMRAMSAMLGQTRALAELVFRYWARAGLPNAVRRDQGRRVSGAILRGAFLLLMMNWGYRIGLACTEVHEKHRVRAAAWLLVGLFGFAFSWGMHARAPQLRQMQSPLQSPTLDPLPITESSRIVIGMLERLVVYALAIAGLVGASTGARGTALGVLLATAGLLAGDALMRLLRTLIAPERMARASFAVFFLQVPSLLVLGAAPMFAPSVRAGRAVAWLRPLARAVVHGQYLLLALGGLFAVCVASAVAIRFAERVGYDRVDVVPTGRYTHAPAKDLTIERIEHLLGQREPGGRWTPWFNLTYVALISLGALVYAHTASPLDAPEMESVRKFVRGAAFLALLMAFSLALGRATRMVLRDNGARAMLAPLPIVPSDLMRGKARALTLRALVVVAPFAVLLGVPDAVDIRSEVGWRIALLVVATALVCVAVVSIAFLTQGLGSMRLLGASVSVETTLVAMPLLAIASAPGPISATLSTVGLALLAFEARRSALRCLRWMDDGEDFERETPVWRALLVFAAFQATQTFVKRALSFAEVDEQLQAAIAYAVGSGVLVAMTSYGRRGKPRPALLPGRPAWLAVGLVAGAATGLFALFVSRWLRARGVEIPPGPSNPTAALALLASVVFVAPVAEELFFRGWLQDVIATELGGSRRWLAPLVAAFAFAMVHPVTSFVPVLALGGVCGVLFARTRSLGAGIAAHASHGAVALLGAGYFA